MFYENHMRKRKRLNPENGSLKMATHESWHNMWNANPAMLCEYVFNLMSSLIALKAACSVCPSIGCGNGSENGADPWSHKDQARPFRSRFSPRSCRHPQKSISRSIAKLELRSSPRNCRRERPQHVRGAQASASRRTWLRVEKKSWNYLSAFQNNHLFASNWWKQTYTHEF